ncbi:major capsid protein [Microvirus sp.]|nr:major capsid protein [Microvirus sp.]
MSKDSNIMGFHSIKNKTHFNTFNLDRRNLFTAKIGQLLPIFCEEVIPGDEIKINMQHFSRSMPVQTAAFTRLKENIQFFFVPYTALWSFYREAMKNMPLNQANLSNSHRASSASEPVELATKLPSFSTNRIYHWFKRAVDHFGISHSNNVGGSNALRVAESARLLQSLGYGNYTTFSKLCRDNEYSAKKLMLDGSPVSSVEVPTTPIGVRVSPFRLLAYHKIANDFYHYDKWEEYCAASCNVDYVNQSDPNMDSFLSNNTFDAWLSEANTTLSFLFDMEYSRLPLDRFNGGLPKAQFGDESVVSLTTPPNDKTGFDLWTGPNNQPATPNAPVSVNMQGNRLQANSKIIAHQHDLPDLDLSIIALRKATALQRYKEIQECNDTDFVYQIEAHFGVKPNQHGSHAKFIGGYSSVFDINPQINQNLAGGNVANIQAAPTSNAHGSCSFKVADDYGIVMGIYRITPQLDYAECGLDSRNLMVDASDYPIPELDSIGMDTLKINSLVVKDYPLNGNADMGGVNTSYAYAPRYLDFKLSYDRFSGAFLSTLRTWVTGQQLSNLEKYAASAPVGGSVGQFIYYLLYCPPIICANVFVNQRYDGIDNDQFMIGSFIGCSVKRKLSVYGLPYSN